MHIGFEQETSVAVDELVATKKLSSISGEHHTTYHFTTKLLLLVYRLDLGHCCAPLTVKLQLIILFNSFFFPFQVQSVIQFMLKTDV